MARVLTVDDSKAVRMIVVRQLQGWGHVVDEAEDGASALARLGGAAYDLVILDVTMPVMDGPALLMRMREMGDTTPVLVLTSESKRSIIAGLMKAGITDYILKPFKADRAEGQGAEGPEPGERCGRLAEAPRDDGGRLRGGLGAGAGATALKSVSSVASSTPLSARPCTAPSTAAPSGFGSSLHASPPAAAGGGDVVPGIAIDIGHGDRGHPGRR